MALGAQNPGLYPNAEVQLQHTDNARAAPSGFEESDQILVVKPELLWVTTYQKHQLDLRYEGNYGLYRDDTDLDYDDHELTAHALLDHKLPPEQRVRGGLPVQPRRARGGR